MPEGSFLLVSPQWHGQDGQGLQHCTTVYGGDVPDDAWHEVCIQTVILCGEWIEECRI